MERWVRVVNTSRGRVEVMRARWCSTFLCRLRGLMFRPAPEEGHGLILVEDRESRSGTAIHMAFVGFPIGVAWADSSRHVIDCRVARPWRIYIPRRPARYVIEGSVGFLGDLAVGDVVEFFDAAMD